VLTIGETEKEGDRGGGSRGRPAQDEADRAPLALRQVQVELELQPDARQRRPYAIW
jgi:hypothetical protein